MSQKPRLTKSIVLGAQWGDEGKGKIVDLFAEEADAVVRFNGGHNAGHTVYVGSDKKKVVLHIVPSGIFNMNTMCYIGSGCVVDLEKLYFEIRTIEDTNVRSKPVNENLKISSLATLILPWHVALDKERDSIAKIGTTAQGNGPAYEDRPGRRAIRYGDLFNDNRDVLLKKLEISLLHAVKSSPRHVLEGFCNVQDVLDDLLRFRDILQITCVDIAIEMSKYKSSNSKVIFEGAQGAMLDVDHGMLPNVTSSTTTAGAACSGAGVPPTFFREIFGVTKAYVTRVGNGYFPTELSTTKHGTPGYIMQTVGNEVGATTGRIRRCGWLDIPALKRSTFVNGYTGLVITKLDVLNGIHKINICVAYKNTSTGNEVDILPEYYSPDKWEPVYEELDGWDVASNSNKNVLNYIAKIAKFVGIPVVLCSIGPNRHDIFNPCEWLNNVR